MNIDYNAVIEILKKFLDNEKIEILGISVGEERQVRDAIRNLLTAYEEEKEDNKELRKYYATRKEVEELREINKILHDSAENYIHKDKMIAKIEEEDNSIKAKAYGVKIEDGYVEDLRKEFFKNAGKYEAWAEFRNKIQELYEESEDKQ